MGKIKDFLIKHEFKLALAGGFILVALVSFETGYLEGKKIQGKPIVIEKPSECAKITQENTPVASNSASLQQPEKVAGAKSVARDCLFVGSKNSNKVHLSTCSFAKRIKPENLVCFKSAEEAISQGRLADKCIK
ncbi:MAG TPA: hypothetical protein DCS28_00560 [Candidatus Moranbacteria bacterium]|nr:hypothetical protein [Candidatus Moranbacteria bacterium]HAT74522.1 hypothetical protein [Candidatus Moranbacteria bacterium]